jgi:hypothetical protein
MRLQQELDRLQFVELGRQIKGRFVVDILDAGIRSVYEQYVNDARVTVPGAAV